jgi:hypothetical protein
VAVTCTKTGRDGSFMKKKNRAFFFAVAQRWLLGGLLGGLGIAPIRLFGWACVAVTCTKTGRDGSFMKKKNGLYFRCGPSVVTGGVTGGSWDCPHTPPRLGLRGRYMQKNRPGWQFHEKKTGLYFRCGPTVVTGGLLGGYWRFLELPQSACSAWPAWPLHAQK